MNSLPLELDQLISKDLHGSFLDYCNSSKQTRVICKDSSIWNIAVYWACEKGHTEIVKLLLTHPNIDPSVCGGLAIFCASKNGHLEIVKLLLAHPDIDPSDNNNAAVFEANYYGHSKVVKALLSDSRVRKKNILDSFFPRDDTFRK